MNCVAIWRSRTLIVAVLHMHSHILYACTSVHTQWPHHAAACMHACTIQVVYRNLHGTINRIKLQCHLITQCIAFSSAIII